MFERVGLLTQTPPMSKRMTFGRVSFGCTMLSIASRMISTGNSSESIDQPRYVTPLTQDCEITTKNSVLRNSLLV